MPKISHRHQFEKSWHKRFISFATSSNNEDAAVAGWSATGLETRLRFFAHLWKNCPPVTNNMLWLDAGCGAGTYSRFLSDQGMRVVGMDYSLPTIQIAKTKGADTPISWCVADATKLPVKQGIFDGALCFGVTQALSRSDLIVTELVSSVRPEGEIWIDALNGSCLPHAWERLSRWLGKRPPHLRYESVQQLRKTMQANGLTDLELFWLPMLPARWSRFQWLLETSLIRWIFQHVPGIGILFSHAFIIRGRRASS